jgi:hypothetical protein
MTGPASGNSSFPGRCPKTSEDVRAVRVSGGRFVRFDRQTPREHRRFASVDVFGHLARSTRCVQCASVVVGLDGLGGTGRQAEPIPDLAAEPRRRSGGQVRAVRPRRRRPRRGDLDGRDDGATILASPEWSNSVRPKPGRAAAKRHRFCITVQTVARTHPPPLTLEPASRAIGVVKNESSLKQAPSDIAGERAPGRRASRWRLMTCCP